MNKKQPGNEMKQIPNEDCAIIKINNLLIEHTPKVDNIGLLDGKMGVAIYFYYISRVYKEKSYQEFAEKLIDDVIEKLQTTDISCSFESGIAGIAWGFEHLMQNNFIESDDVFSSLDDRIFQFIVDAERITAGISGFTGYVNYIYSRIKGGKLNSITLRYHVNLIIELVNKLSVELNTENIFQEPLMFQISWRLPLVLSSLAKILELNIYNHKVQRIIEQYSPLISSSVPYLHSNRLYLLYGLEEIYRYYPLRRWEEHLLLLKQNISIDRILNEEFNDKAIDVDNGVSGVALICARLSELKRENPYPFHFKDLTSRISKSEFWSMKNENVGILHGLTGIGFALLYTKMILTDKQ